MSHLLKKSLMENFIFCAKKILKKLIFCQVVVFFLAKDLKELKSFHSTSWPWPFSFSDISTYPSEPQSPKGWYILILDAWRQSRSILWNQSRPSVRLSVTKFVKIGSLFFPDIVRSDSWPLYLVTDKTRFLKKKIWWPKFRPNEPKSSPKLLFLPFSQV